MSKRKYEAYQVVDDFDSKEVYDYKDAFKAYSKMDAPKTLYGITEQGEIEVIFSKSE